MTDAERELELIAIERERRRRAAAAAEAPVEAPQMDIFGRPMGVGRQGVVADTVAAGVMGASKGLAGLIDLVNLGKEKAFPGMGPFPKLMPKVDALRDEMAGRPVEGSIPAAIAEGATGSLIFPGGPVLNAAAGGLGAGVTQTMVNAGSNPMVAGGTGAGAALGTAVGGSLMNPKRLLLLQRLREALGGANEDDLSGGVRMQAQAAERGVPLFPSQALPSASPGMQQLETEILRSKSPGAADVQQMGFKQAPLAAALAKKSLGENLPTRADASTRDVAVSLQRAAENRMAAGENASRQALDPIWAEAGKTKNVIGHDSLLDSRQIVTEALRSGTLPEQSRGPLLKMKKFLDSRLPDPKLEKDVESLKKLVTRIKDPAELVKAQKSLATAEAALQKAVDDAVVSPQELRTKFQDLETTLNEVDAAGRRTYSDRAAGQVRDVLNKAYRAKIEKVEPMYEAAREQTRSRRTNLAPGTFNPVEEIANVKSGSPEAALGNALEFPQGMTEIAKGTAVRNPQGGRAVEGADPAAVRDALAQALEQSRQQAFQPSNAGEMLQNSPAVLAKALVGTPTKQKGLEGALRSVGVDPAPLMKDLEVLQAAGRPTVVHGSRVPATEISATDVARATFGGSLMQQQAQMGILKSFVNRFSDRQVAEILSRPDSIAYMQQVAGAKAMDPRQLIAVMLASRWQEQDARSTDR